MKWRLPTIVVALLMMLISVALFAPLHHPVTGHPTAQDLRLLTIEETVGLAFYAGTPPCVMRRANPEARDTIFGILSDPSLGDFHLQAANSLGYVCQSSDIGRIEDEIACRASKPATLPTMRDKDVVTALCMALAIMDLRGIEGAAPALRRMATEAYWHDLGAVYYPPGGAAAIVTDADIYRSSAISAYGWTGRSDVEELVRSALASATGGRKRSLERSLRGRLKVAHDSKGFFDKPCDEETHQEWVQGLRECWNNDLQDPQPTARRRVPNES